MDAREGRGRGGGRRGMGGGAKCRWCRGGEDEPLFFRPLGVGGRGGGGGGEGGDGGRRHRAKNSLLLFGRKSERDSGLAIFHREKREK